MASRAVVNHSGSRTLVQVGRRVVMGAAAGQPPLAVGGSAASRHHQHKDRLTHSPHSTIDGRRTSSFADGQRLRGLRLPV